MNRRTARKESVFNKTGNSVNKVSHYRRAQILEVHEKEMGITREGESREHLADVVHSPSYVPSLKKNASLGMASLPTTRHSVDVLGPEVYSPLFQLSNLNLPRDRVTMNAWNRVFYDTHPIVRNSINLHASYPISKINISCKDKKIENFFYEMAEKINLYDVVYGVALEYWKLGEKLDGNSLVTMADGSLKPISEVQIGDYVITHLGNKKKVIDRFAKPTNTVIEEHLSIYKVHATGLPEPLIISGRHPILSSSKDNFYCDTPSCKKKNIRVLPSIDRCSNCGKENPNYDFQPDFIEPNDLKEKDILYSPFNMDIVEDERFTKELCYVIGKWLCNRSTFTMPNFLFEHCGEYSKQKKVSETIMNLPPELQAYILAGFLDGDGSVDQSNGHVILCTSSFDLANQLMLMGKRLGARTLIHKQKENNNYRVKFKANDAYRIFKDKLLSFKNDLLRETKWSSNQTVIQNNWQLLNVKKIEDITHTYQENLMYDIEVEDDHSYIANGIAVHNCFPYAELDRKNGTWKKITILNPDYVFVDKSVIGDHTIISLRPDAALQRIVQSTNPRDIQIRSRLPQYIVDYVKRGQNIPLDSFNISHLKLLSAPYDIRGTSIIVSCYKDLMLYDKLRESKFAQADGMVNPMTLVKLGGNDYRATPSDIAAVKQALEEAQYDKDFKLVTHDGVTIERVGFSGAILDISGDIEQINNNLYTGLMTPKALIDQEGVTYASSSVGLEVLRQRYDIFRNMIKKWLELKIFAPISEIQGFKEYINGELRLVIPTIDFNHMNLWDMSDYIQSISNFVGEKQISRQTLYRTLGLSYEEERRRLREEMIDDTIRMREEASLQGMRLSELKSLDPDSDIPEPAEGAAAAAAAGGPPEGLPGVPPPGLDGGMPGGDMSGLEGLDIGGDMGMEGGPDLGPPPGEPGA